MQHTANTIILAGKERASPTQVWESRRHPRRRSDGERYVRWERPATVTPVQPDATPDLGGRVEGTSVLLGPGGIEVDLNAPNWRPAPVVIIGVLDERQRVGYAGAVIDTIRSLVPGRIRIACRFGGLGAALLQPRNLTPRFDFDTMHFSRRFPDEVLRGWAAAGVLQEVCLDRLLLCPRCQALPTFPHGENLGLDHWANCLRCALRFPWRQAVPHELKGYRACELEPGPIFKRRPRR